MKFNIQTTASGERQEVDVNLALMHEASTSGAKHVLAHLDNKVSTQEGLPTARQQVYAQMGFADKGLTIGAAMNAARAPAAVAAGINAGPMIADDITVTGRLAVQAYLYDTIEVALRKNDYGIGAIFTKKAAQVDSIASDRFERPMLDYTPLAGSRSRAIAQLSEPVSMLKITTSQKGYAIPGTSIGIEYSDQAAKATTLDLVALAVKRQAEEEAAMRVEDFLRGFVNGDPDMDMPALATVSGAVVKANALDTSITVAGKITQKAWMAFLFRNSRTIRIDTVITDLAGAQAIEDREGRPLVVADYGASPRINAMETIVNPTWPTQLEVIISQDPQWPAGQIVGLDSRYAYHLVNSTVLAYEAVEQYAIRRSTRMRFDSGSIAYRLYDQAWQVLDLSL